MVEKTLLEEFIDVLSESVKDIMNRLSELEHHANIIYNVLAPSLKKELSISDIIDIKINLKNKGIMSEHETNIITAFIDEIIDEVYK